MTARSGKEAFVCIAETISDLIVSDIMMPNGDGYSLVENLRSNPRTDLIPEGRLHELSERHQGGR